MSTGRHIRLFFLPHLWLVASSNFYLHLMNNETTKIVQIKRPFYKKMVEQLQSAYPLEACGLFGGQGWLTTQIYPIDNILQSPTAYEMDASQQIRAMLDMEAHGWEMLAIYHSHPHGPQIPSETDIQLAYYPEAIYLIVSFVNQNNPILRAFQIQKESIYEVQWEVV
ncbi:MAG: M67 family metallopeptidase [Chloroflexi bacterium]|nr:M67 family metallopeptidase [Chloroflexota bacterium]